MSSRDRGVQSLLGSRRRLNYALHTALGNSGAFRLMVRLRGRRTHLLVRPDTELVVEGFPRSGNTFLVAALEISQPRALRLAHHLHAPHQVRYAVRHGIPCAIVVRAPVDAVTSLMQRRPYLSARQCLREYISFHERSLPYLDQIFVAVFDDLIVDAGHVVKGISDKFDLGLHAFQHDQENVDRCFALIEEWNRQDPGIAGASENTVSRPSAERQSGKEAVGALVREESRLVSRASELFHRFEAHAKQSAAG